MAWCFFNIVMYKVKWQFFRGGLGNGRKPSINVLKGSILDVLWILDTTLIWDVFFGMGQSAHFWWRNTFLVEKYEDVVKFYFRSLKDTSEEIHLSCDFAEKELFSLILFKNFKINFINTTVKAPYFRTQSSNCVLWYRGMSSYQLVRGFCDIIIIPYQLAD